MHSNLLTRWLSVLLLAVAISGPGVAMAASDSGTLLVGQTSIPCNGTGLQIISGYSTGSPSFGSYSPTGLTGGETVSDIYDSISSCAPSTDRSVLAVSGFSSNPGSSWLSSITCNGVTNTSSGAAVYQYTSGTAYWVWSARFGLNTKVGSNVSCTISHS